MFRNKKKDRLIPTNLYSRAYSSSYSCSDLLDNAPLNAVANDSHVYNSVQWPEFQNVVQKYTMADVSYETSQKSDGNHCIFIVQLVLLPHSLNDYKWLPVSNKLTEVFWSHLRPFGILSHLSHGETKLAIL